MDDFQFYILFNSIPSFQDSGRVTMNGCVQWNPFSIEKIPTSRDLKPETARAVDLLGLFLFL